MAKKRLLMGAAAETLASLRTAVARIEAGGGDARSRPGGIALGPEAVDAALGGGLRRGGLHAVAAASPAAAASATGFAAALAGRAAETGRAVLWIRQDMAARENGELWGPGLGVHGLDPSRLILFRAPDLAAALKAAEAGLASPALAAAVIEPFGAMAGFDRVAGRRLALAAGRTSALALMLRLSAPGARRSAPPLPSGFSAAETRWKLAPLSSEWRPCAAPHGSGPYPGTEDGLEQDGLEQDGLEQDGLEQDGWGGPQALVELVRNRRGGLGRWPLAWGFDDRLFRLAERRSGLLGGTVRSAAEAPSAHSRARAAQSADRPDASAGAGAEPLRRAG
jgi:protein ImuA